MIVSSCSSGTTLMTEQHSTQYISMTLVVLHSPLALFHSNCAHRLFANKMSVFLSCSCLCFLMLCCSPHLALLPDATLYCRPLSLHSIHGLIAPFHPRNIGIALLFCCCHKTVFDVMVVLSFCRRNNIISW